MNDLLDLSPLDPETEALLRRFSFDAPRFSQLRGQLAAGQFGLERNRIAGNIAALQPGDLVPWPDPDSDTILSWREIGLEALRQGQVGVAILNGGMATRFGARVKGVVEVVDDCSFLGLRLQRLQRTGWPVEVFLMNSFATLDATREHLEENDWFGMAPERVHMLSQRISLRLDERGELFRTRDGRLSPYAPGHGDLFEVLAEATEFERFVDNGGRLLLVANVDNLGATLEPEVVGAHLSQGKAVTVEVAPREPNDAGGAPARVDGRVQVVEGFRFPATFDSSALPVFNTNTMLVSAQAVRPDYPLTWFRADKKVEGSAVVQFERLMGEVTAFVEAAYLTVPRQGASSRFLPIKTPDDLNTIRPLVRERLGL